MCESWTMECYHDVVEIKVWILHSLFCACSLCLKNTNSTASSTEPSFENALHSSSNSFFYFPGLLGENAVQRFESWVTGHIHTWKRHSAKKHAKLANKNYEELLILEKGGDHPFLKKCFFQKIVVWKKGCVTKGLQVPCIWKAFSAKMVVLSPSFFG